MALLVALLNLAVVRLSFSRGYVPVSIYSEFGNLPVLFGTEGV